MRPDVADNVTDLLAGPPPANPPLFLAGLIILISLAAPVLFSRAGAPSLLLAAATLALALAGIITLLGAIAGQHKRRADAAIRCRASISPDKIIFHRHPAGSSEVFPRENIKRVWLASSALVVDTTADHAKPGRHRLGFGKLACPRAGLTAAIASLNEAISESATQSTS